MNRESSDEKLLKLIEGTVDAPRVKKVGIKFKGAKLGFFPRKLKLKFDFSLPNLNKIFFILGILLTLVFFYNFFSAPKTTDIDLFFSSTLDKASGAMKKPEEVKAGFLDLREYLEAVTSRNIFSSAGQIIEGPEAEKEDSVKLAELFKDLNLVGIIWSSAPEAMVEDTSDKRTYLLKKGETFGKNQFKIKEINRRSVVLEIVLEGKSKEYELR